VDPHCPLGRNVVSDLSGHGQSQNGGQSRLAGWRFDSPDAITRRLLHLRDAGGIAAAQHSRSRKIIVWFGAALPLNENIRHAASLRK
jgi:hypothetical protein